ncbi:hypothetical protein CFP65_7060 [Kitasatospora sp. MMS16-BH015]|uniref:hemerythrin domain-containing protein n=1 Tax=Kitasatospora sp. MMS16-BH015 TaxID=2018025 RepID=UPI000CA2C3B1|nr:hemerythrin domain-containing protein [Kitasatospora sp. MMS16-BH015]AUG81665.1 hypothetical protein CFP65_7060 [Kitasatospora sp. MMS16-BH015]
MAPQGDLLEELLVQHDAVRVHFSALGGVPLGDPERRRLVDLVSAELMGHLAVEERLLHPVVRRHLADGRTLAGLNLAAHRTVEGLLADLRYADVASALFDRLVARLVEETTRHFGEEEAQLFPAVRAAVPAATLHRLGEKTGAALAHAAVHPKPQPPAVKPPDRLPPPERGLAARLRAFLTPS